MIVMVLDLLSIWFLLSLVNIYGVSKTVFLVDQTNGREYFSDG